MKLDLECVDCGGKGYTTDDKAEEEFALWMQKAWEATSDMPKDTVWGEREPIAEERLGKMPGRPNNQECASCCSIGRWPTNEGRHILKFIRRYQCVMYKFEK